MKLIQGCQFGIKLEKVNMALLTSQWQLIPGHGRGGVGSTKLLVIHDYSYALIHLSIQRFQDLGRGGLHIPIGHNFVDVVHHI